MLGILRSMITSVYSTVRCSERSESILLIHYYFSIPCVEYVFGIPVDLIFLNLGTISLLVIVCWKLV
jgi:hypothetical protein